MNEALCQKFGGGAFPTAADLASQDVKHLQQKAGLGYRAKSIKGLAVQVRCPCNLLSAPAKKQNEEIVSFPVLANSRVMAKKCMEE